MSLDQHFTLTRAQLDEHFAHHYSPAALIRLLDTQFSDLYNQDAGVWECYTLADHTAMVLRQFDTYFGSHSLCGQVDRSLFRLFLALHDIGKPIAIAHGDKRTQHTYTWPRMQAFYVHLGLSASFIALCQALLHQDPIGAYLRDRRSRQETERVIREQAQLSTLTVREYFALLEIYYKVDAGSYTANAGGKRSLDFLFDFDEETPALRFAPDVQRQIDLLRL